MRNYALALRAPAFGWLLLGGAALAWAQGTLDLRVPSTRDGARNVPSGACRVCGEVRSIREVAAEAPAPVAPQNPAHVPSTPGSDWAVVGAAVYTPIGRGTQTDWQVGAVGTPEMAERFDGSSYEIEVRMDDGERKLVRRRDGTRFAIGERVTVSGGMMEKL